MKDKQAYINRIRMPHMFRKSNTDIIDNDISIDMHLAKITRSFRVNLSNSNESTNSYIDCLKNYERLVKSSAISPLEDKLLELRQTLIRDIPQIEEDVVEEVEKMEVVEEVMTEPVKQEIAIVNSEEINIDEIIKTSEQEIFSAKDQRTVLLNLIDDISNNSKNIQYDDSRFEQNIKEIINETQEEELNLDLVEKEEENPVVEDKTNDNDKKTKGRTTYKMSPVLVIIIIIVLSILAVYVNREVILEFFRNL